MTTALSWTNKPLNCKQHNQHRQIYLFTFFFFLSLQWPQGNILKGVFYGLLGFFISPKSLKDTDYFRGGGEEGALGGTLKD